MSAFELLASLGATAGVFAYVVNSARRSTASRLLSRGVFLTAVALRVRPSPEGCYDRAGGLA